MEGSAPCASPAAAAGGMCSSSAVFGWITPNFHQESHPGQELELLAFVAAVWFHQPLAGLVFWFHLAAFPHRGWGVLSLPYFLSLGSSGLCSDCKDFEFKPY